MPPESNEGTPNAGAPNTSAQQPPTGTPPPAAAPPPPAADPATISMPSDAFKERLGREREKERAALLKEFGFEKPDDLKTALRLAQEARDKDLSELDRARKALKEAEPKATRAEHLEKLVAGFVEQQFAGLPENVQQAIDDVAKGNPEERLRMLDVMRKAGLVPPAGAPPAAGTPAAPPPKALAQNGAAPPAPAPTQALTAYQRWQELEKSDPYAAAFFQQANRVAIEQSRPTEQ